MMLLCSIILFGLLGQIKEAPKPPNFIIILVDDQRWDALSHDKETYFSTPALDAFAQKGMYFPNAFVSLSICSPSRAAILSGQYGSKNGVMDMKSRLKVEDNILSKRLKNAGYQTAVFGKWHLPNKPKDVGFDYEFIFNGITAYWDVLFKENGSDFPSEGFVDQVAVNKSIEYLEKRADKPFFLFLNTFAPHMDENYDWPINADTNESLKKKEAPVPVDWNTEYNGKPIYLASNRPHTRALEYGYNQPDSIQNHVHKYALANAAMDKSVGVLIDYMEEENLLDNTYVIVLGDNGWFMAEHGLTSKVLAYEESIRVPFFVVGPKIESRTSKEMVMNTDIFPTILELAGLEVPSETDGLSLKETLLKNKPLNRNHVFYEAPTPVHGTYPHYAIRTKKWKYIITYNTERSDELYFEELYNLVKDPKELQNVSEDRSNQQVLNRLRKIALNEINLSKLNQATL